MNSGPSTKEKMLAMSQAIQESRDMFMLRAELLSAAGIELKAKFDAYIQAGFSESQAMQLLCAEQQRPYR